jgi:hypothetical protein
MWGLLSAPAKAMVAYAVATEGGWLFQELMSEIACGCRISRDSEKFAKIRSRHEGGRQ